MSDLPVRPFAADAEERRRFGRYYTPPPLVAAAHRLLGAALEAAGFRPSDCLLADPACGPGAFLGAPEAQVYRGHLGLDLDGAALAEARQALPGAELIEGDAYAGGLAALETRLAAGGPLAVIGNPPYVANSELLKSGRYHEVRDRLLPFAREVAKRASVRDDYVLFFGVADRLLEAAGGRGALAFVTSASFVDNFLYAPLRRWLLSRYRLHALVELGPELFEGTRVATALSVWIRDPAGHGDRPFAHARLAGSREERLAALAAPLALSPARPQGEARLLNGLGGEDAALLESMRSAGDPIGSLFPISFPGLKTRFEELLVDEDGGRLQLRMREFFEATDPEAFARRHRIPERARAKLDAAFAARRGTRFDKAALRPFARFAGPKHRYRIGREAMAWAYLDPKLIPRGDHRLHGAYDPHRLGPKLVFNVREVPLVAAVVEGPACVHDWRHARFAPLYVPGRVLAEGLAFASRGEELGAPALNLAPTWAEAAARFDAPGDLLFYVSAVVNSPLVQERFAPRVGASEEVPIPRPDQRNDTLARWLAAEARRAEPGGALRPEAQEWVRELYGLA